MESKVTKESCCVCEKLGEYIHQLRLSLGVSIVQLCRDCHISSRTYYESNSR